MTLGAGSTLASTESNHWFHWYYYRFRKCIKFEVF